MSYIGQSFFSPGVQVALFFVLFALFLVYWSCTHLCRQIDRDFKETPTIRANCSYGNLSNERTPLTTTYNPPGFHLSPHIGWQHKIFTASSPAELDPPCPLEKLPSLSKISATPSSAQDLPSTVSLEHTSKKNNPFITDLPHLSDDNLEALPHDEAGTRGFHYENTNESFMAVQASVELEENGSLVLPNKPNIDVAEDNSKSGFETHQVESDRTLNGSYKPEADNVPSQMKHLPQPLADTDIPRSVLLADSLPITLKRETAFEKSEHTSLKDSKDSHNALSITEDSRITGDQTNKLVIDESSHELLLKEDDISGSPEKEEVFLSPIEQAEVLTFPLEKSHVQQPIIDKRRQEEIADSDEPLPRAIVKTIRSVESWVKMEEMDQEKPEDTVTCSTNTSEFARNSS